MGLSLKPGSVGSVLQALVGQTVVANRYMTSLTGNFLPAYGLSYQTTGMGFDSATATIKFYTNGSVIWLMNGGTGAFENGNKFISTIATGNDAFVINVAGARFHLSGSGTTDYFDSDGATQIRAAGNFAVNGARLDLRSAAFTNFSLGTAGNELFGVATGSRTTASLAVGSTTTVIGTLPCTISKNVTVVGSPASTAEGDLMTFPLSGGALNTDTMGIRVTAWGDGVSTADVTTVRCYFGATVVVSKVLTASQANTWKAVFEVFRTAAATQTATAVLNNGGTANTAVQANAAPGETLSGAVTVKCTGQRATSSVANSVRQLGMLIEAIN